MPNTKPLDLIKNLNNSFLNSNLPPSVSHYTDVSGAIGILNKNNIWLSNVRFSNDNQELTYAKTIINLFVESEIEIQKERLVKYEFNAIAARSFLGLFGYSVKEKSYDEDVFASCFCENKDLLSQWRGYAGDVGYSIGFNPNELLESANRSFQDSRIVFQRIIYDEKKWLDQIKSTCRQICEYFYSLPEIKSSGELDDIIEMPAKKLASYVRSIAPFIKHPGFSEEQEWRLAVIRDRNASKKDVEFRASGVGILPYLVLDTESSVRSILIGPQKEQFLSMQALDMVIDDRPISIETSGTPLR